MVNTYYQVIPSGEDWALISPAGVRVKLYTVEDHETSEKAFRAATRECNKRNLKIIDDKKK